MTNMFCLKIESLDLQGLLYRGLYEGFDMCKYFVKYFYVWCDIL